MTRGPRNSTRPKRRNHARIDPLHDITPAERTALRHRAKLVEMIDDLQRAVRQAPAEVDVPRESIRGLLMAAYYVLDLKPGIITDADHDSVKSAIRELQKALGPLGLGIDYWDKINQWRLRDLTERGGTDFLIVE